MQSGGDELWTTGRVVQELKDLGVGRKKVWRLVEAGQLTSVRTGPRDWRRISAASVLDYRRRVLAGELAVDPTENGDSE